MTTNPDSETVRQKVREGYRQLFQTINTNLN
jgi:hypothetical protein